MARQAFNADLVVRQPYLSMVFAKIPGEADWTLIDQGRVLTPNQTAAEKEYNRIGDPNTTKVAGSITTDVTVQLYCEGNIEEVARILGVVRPGGGWVGNEVVRLDPSKIIDFKIENYDGITVGANLVHTEYVNHFAPMRFGINLDAEGDVRMAELSGAATDYYIIPEAD